MQWWKMVSDDELGMPGEGIPSSDGSVFFDCKSSISAEPIIPGGDGEVDVAEVEHSNGICSFRYRRASLRRFPR